MLAAVAGFVLTLGVGLYANAQVVEYRTDQLAQAFAVPADDLYCALSERAGQMSITELQGRLAPFGYVTLDHRSDGYRCYLVRLGPLFELTGDAFYLQCHEQGQGFSLVLSWRYR